MNWIKTVEKTWREIKADPKTVREFGFILSGFFFLAPLMVASFKTFFRHEPFHSWWGWLVFSALTLGLNLFVAPLVKWIYQIAMFVAHGISWVLMRVILGILFYLVLSPIAIAMRLAGKDLLNQRIDKSTTTYWQKRSAPFDRKRYERLF